MDRSGRRIATEIAREAMARRALSVVLTGSAVTGGMHLQSDIDLIVVLARQPGAADLDGWLRPYRMRGRRLISVAWTTPARTRAAFRDPGAAPTFVPGWREAVVFADPSGVAARLKRSADRWRWETIAPECDAWVAERITGLAEEAHKLAGLYAAGNTLAAAAQRALLAVYLAGAIAVHRRILFATDNVLWERVGEAMGPRWRREQRRALGIDGESLLVSCRAALALYALAAAAVAPVLGRDQRAVVEAASRLRIRR